MTLISVDVESDGPIQGIHSMVSFGAVVVDDNLDQTFYGEVKPISDQYVPDALVISGFSREEHEQFGEPVDVMWEFKDWLDGLKGKPQFIADNPGYDFAWINYYFLRFVGTNPFGWSSRRIGDLFCGFNNNFYNRWKKHRKYKFGFKHNHNALDDAKANAAALLFLRDSGFNLKV